MSYHIIQTHPPKNKSVYKIWRLICYLPWAWLILITVFTFGVTIQVGYFPYYGHSYPRDIGLFTALYSFILFSLLPIFISIPIWGILGVAIQWVTSYRFHWQDVVLYLLGIFICSWVGMTLLLYY